MEINFNIKKENGRIIRGIKLFQENVVKPARPIILSHGFTADMRSVYVDAKALIEDGYICYIFDFCGGGFETISDGNFHSEMTPLTEVDDLIDVVNYVQNDPDVNRNLLTLVGYSQGGFVSGVYASRYPENVERLILNYPAYCIPDDARNGSMQIIKFDPNNIPDFIGEGRMRLNGDYARSVIDFDMYKEIAGYNDIVLLNHGDADSIVPISYSDKAKDVYGDKCEYHVLKGAPHGFHEEPYSSESIKYMKAFLKKKKD